MAQTKRKRRNKHRGNAVGMVEARGRTSKPSAGAPGKGGTVTRGGGGRRPLPLKPPTWQSAALKAGFGCVILFVFFQFLANNGGIANSLAFCGFAFLAYTPIMFYTDKFIYNRKLRQQQSKP